MSYKPGPETAHILDKAYKYIKSVPYQVTARWVFYRLLQDGTLGTKADYKRLLTYLSKARKGFYKGWTPDILSDDTRRPVIMQRRGFYTLYIRGHKGFASEDLWLDTLKEELNCPLDRWDSQPNYVEVWFEASAMEAQFLYHCNENVPLLAFHGDVSIPAKWECAKRIHDHWTTFGTPVKVMYFGDYDDKGLMIPESAERDVRQFVNHLIAEDMVKGRGLVSDLKDTTSQDQEDMKALDLRGTTDQDQEDLNQECREFQDSFEFTRLGINEEQIETFGIPENPERPGTYQWEGLEDWAAEELIDLVNGYLDLEAFETAKEEENKIMARVKTALDSVTLEPEEDQDAG